METQSLPFARLFPPALPGHRSLLGLIRTIAGGCRFQFLAGIRCLILALLLGFGTSANANAQSGFRALQFGDLLWVTHSATPTTEITIRPYSNKYGVVSDAFTLEVNGSVSSYGGVNDIVIWSSASQSQISVFVDGIHLGGDLSVELGDGHDRVVIDDCLLGGNVTLDMGDGDNGVSMGDSIIGGSFRYVGGYDDDTFNDSRGVLPTSQEDCLIYGNFSYEDVVGNDWVELNRFQILYHVDIDLGESGWSGGSTDTVRITSADPGEEWAYGPQQSGLGAGCLITHDWGLLDVEILQTDINQLLEIRAEGNESHVRVASPPWTRENDRMAIGGILIAGDNGPDVVKISGVQTDAQTFVSTGWGDDEVEISHAHSETVTVDLGAHSDTLVLNSLTVKLFSFVLGGSGKDYGDATLTDLGLPQVFGFEVGNLAD